MAYTAPRIPVVSAVSGSNHRLHTPAHTTSTIQCRRCFVRGMWISSRIVDTWEEQNLWRACWWDPINHLWTLLPGGCFPAFFTFTGTWGDDTIFLCSAHTRRFNHQVDQSVNHFDAVAPSRPWSMLFPKALLLRHQQNRVKTVGARIRMQQDC